MRSVAALVLLACLPVAAQAQQAANITLACNGFSRLMAASDDIKPDPITNIGIIVSFGDRSVSFDYYRIPIESVNSTQVAFHGQHQLTYGGMKLKPVTVDGTIDRVTGSAAIQFMHENVGNNQSWELTCKPATRLF